MARLNTRGTGRAVSSPVVSQAANFTTHEGGVAFQRNAKGELFMLGVNFFAGEDTFYESGKDRDKRFSDLVAQVAVEDPAWIFGFLSWLRSEGNIRTASIMGAADAVHARLNDPKSVAVDQEFASAGEQGWNRRIVNAVCQRADEPGEFLAYWTGHYGKPIPQPVKRGLGDATGRLYNEYALQKYDTSSHAWRFGDVVDICHIAPTKPFQEQLFGLAIANRHGNAFDHTLPMILANQALRKEAATNPRALLDPVRLASAGMTWEDTLSLAGNSVPKKELWEAQLDSMGYMAVLRNLRNFQEAGISAGAVQKICNRLADPAEVAKSRQFPYRFLSAYKAAEGAQWAYPLEQALSLSVGNVPELPGQTLVLSDISASMSGRMSGKSQMSYAEAAAIFAGAIALRNPGQVEFVGFADNTFTMPVKKGGSLLRLAKDFYNKNGSVGGGTQTIESLRKHYDPGKHDRVIIITDMQAFEDYGSGYGFRYDRSSNSATVQEQVSDKTWLYGFSLGGYKPSMLESGSGRVHELGGLTDSTFKMIPLLESGESQKWPWENK